MKKQDFSATTASDNLPTAAEMPSASRSHRLAVKNKQISYELTSQSTQEVPTEEDLEEAKDQLALLM